MSTIEILMVIISLIAAIIAATSSIIVARKGIISDTIIKRRIDILKEYQENVSNFYSELTSKHNPKNDYRIISCACKIKIAIKDIYPYERLMLSILDDIIAMLDSDDKDTATSRSLALTHFKTASDIYELAYWRFIIAQTKGRKIKTTDLDFWILNTINEKLNTPYLSQEERNFLLKIKSIYKPN